MGTSTTRVHTTSCGVEPYDKCFGVGAKKKLDSGGFSPYERINKLREIYKNTPLSLDSGRALAFTEAYKENEAQPVVIKKARALAKYMEVCPLHYEEGEPLFVDDGAPIFGAPIYLEYVTWIYDELRTKPLYERGYNPYLYDEKTKEEILSTEEYWKGKDIKSAFLARLPAEAAKGCLTAGGQMLYHQGVNVDNGVGHVTPDYGYALEKGLGGMKGHIRECQARLGTITTAEGVKSAQFHEAQLTVLEGVSTLFRRYAAFAKEKAGEYSSLQTKDELSRLSGICEHLAEGAPRDFWEAAQIVHMIMNVAHMESNGKAISFGRADQYLYPFYKSSLENGTYTKDFMHEIIEYMYIKSPTHDAPPPNTGTDIWRGGTRGWSGSALILGGVDADGNDATNDLTFMMLDAMVHTRVINPYLAVRMHEGTPYELKVKVAEVIRLGIGHPKLFNDKTAMDAMVRLGVPVEEARDYVNVGCVELEIPGKTWGWHDAASFVLPKAFEYAINNGSCIACRGDSCRQYMTNCRGAGKPIGLETGYLKDFKTYEEVCKAFEAQLKYWMDRMVQSIEIMQMVYAERDECPFMSSLVSDCTEKGKGLNEGGARYNFTGVQVIGAATVADSLSALKQFVYDEKKFTAEEFYDALSKNWEGHERLYQLVNSDKAHHYGNDDDYADEIMSYVFNTYCGILSSYPPTRGGIGKLKPGSFSVILNLMFGMGVSATPDGRKHGEAISENLGAVRTAVSNHSRSSPTAYGRSVGKLDHAQAGSGTLINMKFGVDTISGDRGRENFMDFVDGYFSGNPMHIQFMVANRETLIEAQQKPEEYQDLLVRVSGFSSQFHTLSKGFQDELINRTEHSFD